MDRKGQMQSASCNVEPFYVQDEGVLDAAAGGCAEPGDGAGQGRGLRLALRPGLLCQVSHTAVLEEWHKKVDNASKSAKVKKHLRFSTQIEKFQSCIW